MMDPRILKRLAVVVPVTFWGLLVLVRAFLLREPTNWWVELVLLLVLLAGALLFSNWVFDVIAQREAEVRERSEQLAALHEAALALTTVLDLGAVLEVVVRLATELSGAQYGALGVLDDDGDYIEQFITVGITPEQRARMGELPRGHGLLGVLIEEGRPIRIPEIGEDPRSVGFPPDHPPMHTLLGVPIKSKGRVIGDLYLTDKQRENGSYTVFTDQDQQILEMFATQAAIAIENAQLYRQNEQLVILKERERIGMDLHDGIIQHIYAIGLMLEDTQHQLVQEGDPESINEGIAVAIKGLNEVIRDIRNYILDLRPQRFQGRNLFRGLEELVRDLRANTFMNISLNMNGVDSTWLTPGDTVEILHVVQEAFTNIRKHARATHVEIDLYQNSRKLMLEICDNGVGIAAKDKQAPSGNGLRNMQERARSLGGQVRIEPRHDGGTKVELSVPFVKN